MTRPTAVISMLHEEEAGSAGRRFRGEPVMSWTLDRLSRSETIDDVTLVCWEDQLSAVEAIAEEFDVGVLTKGKRVPLSHVEAVSASRRWADGWRGGLLQTCDFDLGFHGPSVVEVLDATQNDSVVLIDPSSALVDPELIDAVVYHAENKPELEFCFTPAAPGLGGTLLRRPLIERLAAAGSHPGRLLHYSPDQPARDPIGADSCAPVPTPVARTLHRFRLDSERQVARITEAFVTLNGHLASTNAEELVSRFNSRTDIDPLPREVVIELNTTRRSKPIYRPSQLLAARREPMKAATICRLLEELCIADDTRLTFSGVGDPLESDVLFEALDMAHSAGIRAVHVETDLLCDDKDRVIRLAESPLDLVSFHLPAMTPATYAAVMGVDAFGRVLENISTLVKARQARNRGIPLVVPTFVKCRANLAEMEIWYDQWLRAVGCAVITGPSDFAGLIPNAGAVSMTPPLRRACARLSNRMTVLSNGVIVACEEDVLGSNPMGRVGEESIERIWVERFDTLRACHRRGVFDEAPLCAKCGEWHRP